VPRASNGNGLKERLQDFCKKRIPPLLIPKEIILLHALPKNSAGKVLKQNLRVM
jgi:acyl-coenzyme A synthetase/AMP-(fatty) acid ligase